jgi:O-antigen/teichoic acid export membrane protein
MNNVPVSVVDGALDAFAGPEGPGYVRRVAGPEGPGYVRRVAGSEGPAYVRRADVRGAYVRRVCERAAVILQELIEGEVLSTVAVRFLIVVGGFASSIVTARWLSPAGRGEYVIAVTFAQMLAQFGNLGLQSSNTYLAARDRNVRAALVTNSMWVAAAAGAVAAALIVFADRLGFATADRVLLWFVPVLAAATLFYSLGTSLLVGLKRLRIHNVFQLAGNYAVLGALAVAAALHGGPRGFLAASAIGWTLVSIALLRSLRDDSHEPLRFDRAVFGEGFGYALKAYVATLAGFIILRTNVFLLGWLGGAEQVGYYSIASQIADVMSILPQSMALVLFPTLVASAHDRMATTLRQMAVAGGLLLAGCAGVWLLADPFVRTVFGPKFLPAVPALRYMLPGVFFLGLTSVLSQYLAAGGFPRLQSAAWIGGCVVAAAAGRVLIPSAGGAGAALALSITHFAVFVLIAALAVRTHVQSRIPATARVACEGAAS